MYTNAIEVLLGKPYSFLQVEGQEEQAICGSYRNLAEAHRVVDLVHSLYETACQSNEKWHAADRVRIITFYRAQVVLVQQLLSRRGLPRVLVATVDSSQGCEAELVIVSFVRSKEARCDLKPEASRLDEPRLVPVRCRFPFKFEKDLFIPVSSVTTQFRSPALEASPKSVLVGVIVFIA